MKTKTTVAILVLVLGLIFCEGKLCQAAPMGTTFTYQGFLYDANYPANDFYDFLFKLHDARVGGSQVGVDVNMPDIDVIDGSFAVELDFGSDAFSGDARWLEIAVRPGDSNDRYTTLSPRQEVTPVPYAVYAETAGSVQGVISGSGTANYIAKFSDPDAIGNSIIYESASNVGIGTTSPSEKLEVDGTVNATAFVGDGSGLTGITITETDPTVLASVKDGISWGEVSGRPAGLDDGDDVGITTETDPTVLASVKDGISWGEVSSRPAGLDDGDDIGITSESDTLDSVCSRGSSSSVQIEISSTSTPTLRVTNTNSIGGNAIIGHANGDAPGVLGESDKGKGVAGASYAETGIGVSGTVYKNTGVNYGGYFKSFSSSGTGVYGYGDSYDFYAAGPGTNYGAASSIRWKSDIRAIDEPLEKVMSLRGVYFKWDVEHGGCQDIGMIAEDVGNILPEIVEYEEDGEYATGMDYSKLTPLLVEALKKLKGENDRLRERVEALEKTIIKLAKTKNLEL